MAPPAADIDVQPTIPDVLPTKTFADHSSGSRLSGPLTYSGSLDSYEQFDVTAVIGRELPALQLTDILNDDTKVCDLAILASQRGVVFFRNQDIGIDDQSFLANRGIAVDENGKLDDEVSVISSERNRKYYSDRFSHLSKRSADEGWHADITFEWIPSDYAILKIVQPPADAGGDTLWASGYEVKDAFGADLIDDYRGAPENTGLDFKAEHPVIRTNPVTGWKSLFGAAHQVKAGWINGMTERGSEILKTYFYQVIAENHDLQVRFRWGKNDLAIWDNRSVFHTATNDYADKRQGNRVVSLGEKPYFDPNSKSRREALGFVEQERVVP